MRKVLYLLMLVSTLALTACAMGPQGQWVGPLDRNVAQDDLECRALAAQAASGAGGWSSDRAMRAALYDNAVEQYYWQCVKSRGYEFVPTR